MKRPSGVMDARLSINISQCIAFRGEAQREWLGQTEQLLYQVKKKKKKKRIFSPATSKTTQGSSVETDIVCGRKVPGFLGHLAWPSQEWASSSPLNQERSHFQWPWKCVWRLGMGRSGHGPGDSFLVCTSPVASWLSSEALAGFCFVVQ